MRLVKFGIRRDWKTLVLALACLLVAAAAWSVNGGRDRTALPGAPFRHDDWSFNVRSARRLAAEKLDNSGSMTLRLEVRNEAKRVAYTFRPETALIVDDQGRSYRPAPGPAGPCGASLPAGSACTAELRFEMPDDAKGLRFRLDAGGVGDLLERVLFGWRWVELEPGRPR